MIAYENRIIRIHLISFGNYLKQISRNALRLCFAFFQNCILNDSIFSNNIYCTSYNHIKFVTFDSLRRTYWSHLSKSIHFDIWYFLSTYRYIFAKYKYWLRILLSFFSHFNYVQRVNKFHLKRLSSNSCLRAITCE